MPDLRIRLPRMRILPLRLRMHGAVLLLALVMAGAVLLPLTMPKAIPTGSRRALVIGSSSESELGIKGTQICTIDG